MRPRLRTARCGVAVAAALLLVGAPASAQRRPAPEFTQQGILVANFWVAGAAGAPAMTAPNVVPSVTRDDLRFGRRVGDAVRDRLAHLVNKREAKVISGTDIRESLMRQAFQPDTIFALKDLQQQGAYFRTDEIVTGIARRLPGGRVSIDADLVLFRDIRMRQPITPVTATSFDRAADTVAARISEARVQLKFQRRCENALRDGKGNQAIGSAREGVKAYSAGALVRTCLVWALRATGASAPDVLEEAGAILSIDPYAPHGLEAAAVALDSL